MAMPHCAQVTRLTRSMRRIRRSPTPEPRARPARKVASIRPKAYTLLPATTASRCMNTTSSASVTTPPMPSTASAPSPWRALGTGIAASAGAPPAGAGATTAGSPSRLIRSMTYSATIRLMTAAR